MVISSSPVRPGLAPASTSPISPRTWSGVMAPSSTASRMSPHSVLMASNESTITVDRRTVSPPISRASGRCEPTALMWTPGFSHPASRMGSAASVTAVRTSAPRTTASADSCGWIGMPISSSSSSLT